MTTNRQRELAHKADASWEKFARDLLRYRGDEPLPAQVATALFSKVLTLCPEMRFTITLPDGPDGEVAMANARQMAAMAFVTHHDLAGHPAAGAKN